MPRGQDIERPADRQSGRRLGEPEAEEQDVGNTLIAFPLKVVLGQPQEVMAQRCQVPGQVARDGDGARTPVMGVPAVMGRAPGKADPLACQDMACIEDGKILEQRVTSIRNATDSPPASPAKGWPNAARAGRRSRAWP